MGSRRVAALAGGDEGSYFEASPTRPSIQRRGDSMTPWEIEGRELVNCNCSYGCPGQFNALPTHGFCEAVGGFTIDKGHFGSTRLDGLTVAIAFHWPGPIHEGQGKAQI